MEDSSKREAPEIDARAFREFERLGWESSAEGYSQHLGSLTSEAIPYLLDAVHAGPGMQLIDLATGPGHVAAAALKRGCAVVAVDFSENMVKLARSLQNSAIDFKVADVEKLPQADNSFDAAVMNFGILHLSQPEKALAEMFRILKPGGRIAFTVWAGPEEAVGFNLIRRAIEEHGNSEVGIPDGPLFFGFSDSAYTERVLTEAGFTAVSSERISLVWEADSCDDIFTAIYEGAARTGGLLRRQTPEALAAIQRAVAKNCEPFARDGKVRIPMPAVVFGARRSG